MARIISTEGNLTVVDFGGPGRPVTKKELAEILGKTVRWIEYRMAEGMPDAGKDRRGRRRFDVAECRMWITQQKREAS